MCYLQNAAGVRTHPVDDDDVAVLDAHVEVVDGGGDVHLGERDAVADRVADHVELDVHDVDALRLDDDLVDVVRLDGHHGAQLLLQLPV